jgi:response regulator RpfG family c-di-GMP phosphodiesterase
MNLMSQETNSLIAEKKKVDDQLSAVILMVDEGLNRTDLDLNHSVFEKTKSQTHQIKKEHQSLYDHNLIILEALKGNDPKATQALLKQSPKKKAAFNTEINQMMMHLQSLTLSSSQQSDEHESRALWFNFQTSLIAALAGLILALLITRSMIRPVQRLVHGTREVETGNLDTEVSVTSSDEIGALTSSFNNMVRELKARTKEVLLTQDVAIHSLATTAELRDPETGAHILRTQRYVRELANELKDLPAYKTFLSPENIELLFKSAPLHDIGKVGVPDVILHKPGKLTDEEFEVMKKHAIYGKDILQGAEDVLGSTSFLRLAKEVAYTHQEKWDGRGYPQGLKGEAIPISGRLMALADVYDALVSKRVYKEPFSHEDTVRMISEEAGTHFDPVMVEYFLKIEKSFKNIAEKYKEV